jgi:transposase
VSISSIARENGLKGNTLEKQYQEHLSDYRIWKEQTGCEALVYPKNFGTQMAIDDVYLMGEYYTCITNKAGKGKQGSLAALIKGTKHEGVSKALEQVPQEQRYAVEEMSLDFASSMDWIVRTNFPNAQKVGDRFHAQQFVSDAIQEVRIQLRREALDEESEALEQEKKSAKEARRNRSPYKPACYANGESKKEILARSRYLLYQEEQKWTENQQARATVLFQLFPELKRGYDLYQEFRAVYEQSKTRAKAQLALAAWCSKARESDLKPFHSAARSIKAHEGKILNYFPTKASNASAESFNAKLKGFRSVVRGIRNPSFFLYRLHMLFS